METQTKMRHKYHHWEANKKMMESSNRRNKSRKKFLKVERRQDITKHRNIGFNVDSKLHRKVYVPRRLEKRGRDEVVSFDLKLLFRGNEKNQWREVNFESNEQMTITRTENKKQTQKCVEERTKWRGAVNNFFHSRP